MIPAFVYFCGIIKEVEQYWSGLCFFRECINSSPHLIPALIHLYQHSDDRLLGENILCLIANLNHVPDIESELKSGQDIALFRECAANAIPNLSTIEEISDPQQLNYLWSSFFASGRYIYIENLIKQLSQKEAAANYESQMRSAAISSAAKWSLEANMDRELVKGYCNFFLDQVKSSSKIKEELWEIIS